MQTDPNFVDRSRLLFHSVRHTQPSQLYHRVRLSGLRKLREYVGPPRSFERPPPMVRSRLPRPIFSPRLDLVDQEEKTKLNLIGLQVPWSPALDWAAPVDEKWSQLRRFHLHYMEWLEALDDEQVFVSMEDWVRANPPYGRRYWFDAWSSYVISLRVVVWLQQLATRPPLTGERCRCVIGSIVEQVRVLVDHLELDVEGNHLVKNAKALLWAGAAFEAEEASFWTACGSALLERVLDEQILDDGVHYERSPAYHAQVLADLLECLAVASDPDLRARLREAIRTMTAALLALTHPDGFPSLFNDGGLNMAYSPAECVRAAERARGLPLDAVHAGAFSLPRAGFFGWRTEQDLFLARCGASAPDFLPAHGHADSLSFEWSVAGSRFIVDAGVAEYREGPLRRWARSTAAHNTVTVGDQDQSQYWAAFRCARRARTTLDSFTPRSDGFDLIGQHDGYERLAGHPSHRRAFVVGPDRVQVRDEIRGGEGQEVTARLLLHPEVELTRNRDCFFLERGGVRLRLQSAAALRVRDVPWMPDLGVTVPTRQIVLDYGRAPGSGQFELCVERRPL